MMHEKNRYGIVTRADGLQVWGLTFETIGRAKLSVMNNHFNVKAVGVSVVKNGQAVGNIYVKDTGAWEASVK